MRVEELASELHKDRLAGAYLVCGEEDALVDRAIGLISEQVLGRADLHRGGRDFSLTRLDGRSCAAAEVESAARTASLFGGGRRLVLLREAQAFSGVERKKLARYLVDPVTTTTLVLVVRGAGPKTRDPKRAKLAAAAAEYDRAVRKGGGRTVECPRPKARELPRLARQSLADHGLEVDSDGLYALIDAVGEDLGTLWQAVEKLSLYKGGSGRVTAPDVAEVVADTRSQSVFELTDAVATKDLKTASSCVRRLIRDGESPLAILSHLARHYRNLARVQALAARGESADAIRSTLALHPYVVKKALEQARRHRTEELARCLSLLADTDRKLKRSVLSDSMELQRLVRSLCFGNQVAARSKTAT